MTTYIHEGIEVRLTGRTAVKETTNPMFGTAHTTTLHEITPVDSIQGKWVKWVSMNEMYAIANNCDESLKSGNNILLG